MKMLQNKIARIVALTFVFSSVLFYWFAIRPSQIRKQCSSVSVKAYSQERKDEAKKYVDENCPKVLVPKDKVADCIINRNIVSASLEGQNQKRSATDEEYLKCLRENGLEDSQSLAGKQLKTLQQGIDDQSSKIDNLQREKVDSKNSPTSIDAQAIIKSSIEKTNQEEKAKCQQELSEYNSCLAEYNSKMTEYNSCLTEEANPNSWNYGKTSLCFKPSNYCFKPVCAY